MSYAFREHEHRWADYWNELNRMHIHLVDHSPERGQIFVLSQEEWTNWLHSFAYYGEQGWDATIEYWNELVRIHLADASKERGQYRVLETENFVSTLFSYAYSGTSFELAFLQHWTNLVNIHLAGLPSQNPTLQSQVLPEIEAHLTTYADRKEIGIKEAAWDMRIHLADTTAKLEGETNIKHLLSDEKKPDHLFSHAYQQQEDQWSDSRNRSITENSKMNIHLAGHSADLEMDSQVKTEHQNHLTTYADQKEIDHTGDSVIDLRPRVIIDSGAFTAFTTGKVINPRDYAKWALDFDKRWRSRMAALHFMNLDVIGDQDGSWKNQAILESLGMKPIPIVTFGADKKHLIRALENYEYIALGGLVPYSRQRKMLQKWLDHCFAIVMQHKKKTGVLRKIHLLGITSEWVLQRYPCYSSDSSSWVSCLRFGGGDAAGLKQIPRYKESEGAMAATLHVLRAEIRKFKKMQDDVTKLWASRGIVWED